MSTPHRTHTWTTLSKQRIQLAAANDEPCCRCHQPIDYTLSGRNPAGPTTEHLTPLAKGGSLIVPIEELGVAHQRCNAKHGASMSNSRRRASDLRGTPTPTPGQSGFLLSNRPITQSNQLVMHEDGFPMPRICTPTPEYADDRLGHQALQWIDEHCPGEPLMPWQRWLVRRALETDSRTGRLLWQRVVLLIGRQQGKTYLARRFFTWRLLGAPFGQPERILSTHADGAQAGLLLEPWVREEWKGTGKLDVMGMAVSWYPDGAESTTAPMWVARASKGRGITGYSGLTSVYVDEVQSVPRQVVQRSLLPTMSGSRVRQPQAWFTGTGEDSGSELLRLLRGAAADPRLPTLWVEWSPPPGCATTDEDAWRWASPDWSHGRAEFLRLQVAEMPEHEFRSEYLVQHDARVAWWVPADDVDACGAPGLVVVPVAAAVEVSSDQRSWSAAGCDASGGAVTCRSGLSWDELLPVVRGWGVPVACHQSVANRFPADVETRAVRTHEAAAAVSLLADAVRARDVRWDSPAEVRAQFASVVTASVDGLHRIIDARSRGDVSVVKALSWALWVVRVAAGEAPSVF